MNSNRLPRSPELMSRDDTALLVVDVQEKLVPAILDHERMTWNIRRLIDGARLLGLPVVATEQYPQGLGETISPLIELLPDRSSKIDFSCAACGKLFTSLQDQGVYKVLVCGIEAHVCVQQTVLDLLTAGWSVYVAVDAVSARSRIDYEVALRRQEASGATLTTTESALFEWCQQAGTPEFKEISKLVKEQGPEQ